MSGFNPGVGIVSAKLNKILSKEFKSDGEIDEVCIYDGAFTVYLVDESPIRVEKGSEIYEVIKSFVKPAWISLLK